MTLTRSCMLALAAVMVAVRLAPAAMCGCDKFAPGPAETLRSGGQLRPTVASRGTEVVLFSDALAAGQAYNVSFTPIPQGALPGSGAYLDAVPGEATPRTCVTPGVDDGIAVVSPVAFDARDIADYQPLYSLDGSGPNLDNVRSSDFPLRTQLRVTVPCALPKLGGTRIDVYDSSGALVLSAAEDEFTAIGDPIVLPQDGGLDAVYETGVDTTSHLYIALDLSQALDAVTISGYAKTLALDLDPTDVAAFDVHGIYLDSLREVLNLNVNDSASQALFDFAIVDQNGNRSDEVDYFRHSFTQWAAQHVPPFGSGFPGKFEEDPADPEYWHLADDPLHPFGSTHTTFNHVVVAVTGRWRRMQADGSVVAHDLRPGAQLRFPLHIDTAAGNDVAAIQAATLPAVATTNGGPATQVSPSEARWHRRKTPRLRRLRRQWHRHWHRHRH